MFEVYIIMKNPFLSERKVEEEEEEPYYEQTFKEVHFTVINPGSSSNCGNNQEMCFTYAEGQPVDASKKYSRIYAT